jgi:hypothetical protein
MTAQFIEGDPPQGPHIPAKRGKWQELLAPLVDRPNTWAIVHRGSNSPGAAGNLRAGKVIMPPGQWEFVSRTVEGQGRVYARYLGPRVEPVGYRKGVGYIYE